jgi:DTW domain-containing protein YfiP
MIDSDIELIILQHPSEVKNAIGTARILDLSLPYCQIIMGENFTEDNVLNNILNDPSRQCYLLYPSSESMPVKSLINMEATGQRTFILIDGTWRKAYKMFQLSTNLHRLPAVRCDPASASQYTIRQTSVEGGLSTVEAGHLLLATLEQNSAKYQPLLDAFEYMIDFQISQMPEGIFNKHYKSK